MILLFLSAFAAEDWSDTIDRVLDSCVIIKMDRTRPFDGNSQSSSEASGFVVDAERGLVMTNRHVVTTGPTLAFGIFNNQEEVDLVPVYADPVHDFGIFRYDPMQLEHIQPKTLQLSPESAAVGAEIRVIGNDAAEQLSILAGTLSRLDRASPHWDQNTFYLQAASSTSGGSSGSPVFDQSGRVVALNAGARNDAATSLFLPLDRVKVALASVQAGQLPSRGTIQTVLFYETYEELQRLGLTPEIEAERRAAWDGTGLLTVGRVNDGGPAQDVLEPGDIVLSVDGTDVHGFVAFEAALDAAVGASVELGVLRGGKPVTGSVKVQDLHTLTPSAYLEIAEGLVHPVGYMAGTRAGRPLAGVQVARAGRLFSTAGIGNGAVITEIGGEPVRGLDDAVRILGSIPDGTRVPVRHSSMNAPEDSRVTTMKMLRGIWPARHCERAEDGLWPCVDLPDSPPAARPDPVALTWLTDPEKKLRAAANSLVSVSFQPQLNADTAHGNSRTSVGILLDATGLILTDRHAVPIDTGPVRVRFQDAPSIPVELLYRDPVHNVALVKVDMGLVDLPEDWVYPELSDDLDLEGSLTAVMLDTKRQIYDQPLEDVREKPIYLRFPRYPRYVDRNLTVLTHGKTDRPTIGGVIVDKKGRVVGIERRYSWDEGNRLQNALYGVGLRDARLALERWRAKVTEVPDLGAVLQGVSIGDAREAGLPEQHAAQVREVGGEQPTVLRVRKISGSAPASEVLQTSDWIVAVDGLPVSKPEVLEDALLERGAVELTLVRDLKELVVQVTPLQLPVAGTGRAVLWAGVLVQEEPAEVALFWQSPPEGVYLSWYYGGSPAHRYGTSYSRRLLAVDGNPVNGLGDFIEAVKGKADRSSVRLKLVSKNGKEWVQTLKLDTTWWPTMLFERGESGWTRTPLEP